MAPDIAGAPQGYRSRHRAARRREFLDVARDIVNSEGLGALTMQRVTDVVGSSTGGIYHYFPTKEDLVAALQREAFDVLLSSYLDGQSRLDEWLGDRAADPVERSITRAVAMGQFWIDSEQTLPSEIELSRRLIAGANVIAGDPGSSALPVALRLLDEGRLRLDDTVASGVLSPADNLERAVMLIASTTGVLLTSKLGGWDDAVFDGRRIARALVDDILVGWGATRERLAVAHANLSAFTVHHEIAPGLVVIDGP